MYLEYKDEENNTDITPASICWGCEQICTLKCTGSCAFLCNDTCKTSAQRTT